MEEFVVAEAHVSRTNDSRFGRDSSLVNVASIVADVVSEACPWVGFACDSIEVFQGGLL